MQAAVQEFGRKISIKQKIIVEPIEEVSCFQIREKLDLLFDGDSRLEETNEIIKRVLFRHLETCQKCCRSFDVRVRFRSGGGRRIL
ncbi:MAG TPA: hypothetical protein PKY82_04305 [Pyrinomonadaceae bacterium]|nr:hypothetical protein [Pyrinomonadaceae bacterium]